LTVHQYEPVISIQGDTPEFDVLTRKSSYRAKNVILATGYYDVPNKLDVPGADLPKVTHYYKDAHPYYNSDVAVIGAKNSAAIASLELLWYGARVTMIHRGPGISDSVKYWIKPNIENRIKSGEVKAFFNSHVTEICNKSINVATPDGRKTIPNDYVLALIGYRPDVEFLNSVGVTIDPVALRPLMNAVTLESERPGLYLAGVIVAGMHTSEIFIENGRFHGKVIAEAIVSSQY
jgi:bacillithiol disulfide reductase